MDQSGYDLSEGKVVPLKINFFDGIKVLNITSGGNHSIILTGKFNENLSRTSKSIYIWR